MKKLVLSLAWIFSVSLAFSQSKITSEYIDSLVNYAMNSMPHAGIAIGVVQDNEIIHLKGYGIASSSLNTQVNEETLFAIASNTKAFTATALGILVDQGKLSWEDKVVDHIPEFTMYDPYVTANFTIVDLLTHRSGLGLGAGDLMFIPDGTDFTIDDVLKSFQYQKPVSAFRTKYDYDNLLYKVAGEVVSRVSGKSWNEFVESHIMQQIDMNSSVASYQAIGDYSNTARPHIVSENKLRELKNFEEPEGSMGADGAIYANVKDMCEWMKVHLNQGKYGDSLNNTLFSDFVHNEMWKIHTNMFFSARGSGYFNKHYHGYGLGFFLYDLLGYSVVEHTGGIPGMLSSVFMVPELNFGIVILTNCDPGGYSYATVTNQVFDKLANHEEKNWIDYANELIEVSGNSEDSVLTAVWKKVEKSKKKKINHSDFTGVYVDNWFGEIEIKEKDGYLWFIAKRSPKLKGKMSFYQANTFVADWEYDEMECDAFIMFQLDENGKAQSIKMKGISPNIDFSFDFHDLDLRRVKN